MSHSAHFERAHDHSGLATYAIGNRDTVSPEWKRDTCCYQNVAAS